MDALKTRDANVETSQIGGIERIPKVCFAASSGGHLEEILRLRRMRERCPHFFITEKAAGMESIANEKVYTLPQMKRSDPVIPFLLVRAFVLTAQCLRTECPDIVVSTGALATVPAIVLGHVFGSKVVYIESQARTSSLSLTGKVARRFADAFFVQWGSLAEAVPGTIYRGMLS